jgi:type I restriction enzyme S subunit
MGSDWQEMPLEDAMDAIIDYRGKTPRKTDSGIPLITAKIVKNGRINPTQEYIAEADYDSWMQRGIPQKGDVVLTTEAPLGEVAQLDGSKIALAQRIITLRGKAGLLESDFLKYLLQSNDVRHQLDGRASGTTVSGIKQSELRQVLLSFPPLPEQKAIAHILGTLDDKIELNRRMNATLEGMAQALFKSWFVDFDPVIDNAIKAGNPIPDELAARAEARRQALANGTANREAAKAFPAAFQETEELGWIPEGWEVSTIGDECETVGGGTPSTKNSDFWEDGEYPWVTPKDFSGLQDKVLLSSSRFLTEEGLGKVSSGLLPIGTVLMSSRAPVGYLAITQIETAINQGFIGMICNKQLPPEYILQWANSRMDDIKQASSGSTFAEISKKGFRPFKVIVPDLNPLEAYSETIAPMYAQITDNVAQSDTLSSLRDTLLPKLISGELRLDA